MSTAHRLAAVTLLLLAGASCRPKTPDATPSVPVSSDEADEIRRSVAREAASVARYQGFLRIRGKGPEGGFDGRLVVVFDRPHRLRVELLGPFGTTRWAAVANGEQITVVFPGRDQYVQESDVGAVVSRLLGVRLEVAEVMDLLAGSGGSLAAETEASYRRGATMTLQLADGTELDVLPDGQVARLQTSRYRSLYPTRWKEGSRQVPDRIRIEADAVTATIEPDGVDVNVPVNEEAFRLEVPEGAARLRPAEVSGESVFVVTKTP